MMIYAKNLHLGVANKEEIKIYFVSALMDLKTVTAGKRTKLVHSATCNLRTIIFPMNWRQKGNDAPD